MELEHINAEWLKIKIDKYHNGNREEFAKAVFVSTSLLNKMFSYRSIADYHKDHFFKHFLLLEKGFVFSNGV